jgi:hypothetical protein
MFGTTSLHVNRLFLNWLYCQVMMSHKMIVRPVPPG